MQLDVIGIDKKWMPTCYIPIGLGHRTTDFRGLSSLLVPEERSRTVPHTQPALRVGVVFVFLLLPDALSRCEARAKLVNAWPELHSLQQKPPRRPLKLRISGKPMSENSTKACPRFLPSPCSM